jgi:hypothetical protein
MVATMAPGPASSGVPSGNERHVRHLPFGLGRLLGRAGQQLQRDQEQQQPARTLQRRQLDAEVGQDQLAEKREDHDYAECDQSRLPSQLVTFLRCTPAGQAYEDGHSSRRVNDDEQGDEDLPEELHAEEPSWQPRTPGSISMLRP